MENLYHAGLYDLLQYPTHRVEQLAAVNLLKVKLVILYSTTLPRATVETQTKKLFRKNGCPSSTLRRRTRCEQRTITNVQNLVRRTQTSTKGIVDAFSYSLRQIHEPILVDGECVRYMAVEGHRHLSDDWKEALGMPLSRKNYNVQ